MLRIRNTAKDQGNKRAVLVDRYDTGRELLILRGIEAGEGISLEVVSNDPGVYATSDKIIRISANANLPTGGDEGEVLTIGPSGEFLWTLPPGAGGGEANTGSNLAGDTGVYASKIGSELRFRGISGGNGITAQQSATTITLVVDEGDLDLAAMSGNLPVPLGGTGRTTFLDNSILVGNGDGGIDTTPAASTGYLYYNGSAFSWTTPAVGEINLGASLGGDAAVFSNKTGTTLNFRGISGGAGIDVVQNINNIAVTVVPSEIDIQSLDGVLGVTKGGTGRVSFPDGSVIIGNETGGFDATPAASNGYLRYSAGVFSWDTPPSGETNIGSSLGGLAIYAGKTSSTLNFRGLAAGTGIDIVQNANDLTVSVDASDINIGDTTGTLALNRGGTGATTATDARTALGLGSMATQNANAVNITGGNASLTALTVSGQTTFNGVAYAWPVADGSDGQVLSTDGAGQFAWIDMASGTGGETNTGLSLGGATAVFAQKSGSELQFRGLSGGNAVELTQTADQIAIAVDPSAIDFNDITGDVPVARGGTGRTSLAGNAILLGNGTDGIAAIALPGENNVFLSFDAGAYSWETLPEPGEANTATALGGDADVFVQKNGLDFEFRGISAGTAITVTEGVADVVIGVDASGIDITATTGTLGVPRGGTGLTTVTPNAILIGNGANAMNIIGVPGLTNSYLRWNGTAYEWVTLPDLGEDNTASSLGGDAAIFAQKNGVDLEFRGLTAGIGIDLLENADEIVVTVDQSAIDIGNTTGNLEVARGGTGGSSFTSNAVLLGNGTGAFEETPVASTGYLRFDGANFVWDTPSATVANLVDIGDVVFDVAAENGDVLTFDGTNWIALAPAGGTGGGEANTASNVGGDVGLFALKSAADLQFRGLTAGNAIALTENADHVLIAVDESAIDVTATTGTLPVSRGGTGQTTFINASLLVGNGGSGLLSTPAAVEGQYLTYTGGAFAWSMPTATIAVLDDIGNVDAADAENNEALVFNGTDWVARNITPVNTGAGAEILTETLNVRSLVEGANVTITEQADTITIAASGEANTASNLGLGSQLFSNKDGVDLEFRSIIGIDGVVATQNADDVTLSVDASALSLTDMTGTLGVDQGGTGQTTFAANGVLIGNATGPIGATVPPTDPSSFLSWNGTGFEWATIVDNGENNDGANLGDGSAIYSGKTGQTLQFRSLEEGSNLVSIVVVDDEVVIDIEEGNIALANLAGTLPVGKGGTGATTLTDGGLLIGAGTDPVTSVGVPDTADTFLRWSGTAYEWAAVAVGTGEANDGTSLGGDAAVYVDKAGETLNFRGITAGHGIDVTTDPLAITVAVDETELDLANMGGTLGVAQGGTGATTAADGRTALGLGTMAEQDADAVNISGGSINNVAGAFTTLAATGATTFNGVSYTWPGTDGDAGQVLSTNADGTIAWIDASSAGEANAGVSLGGEQAIYTGKSGTNLQFRGLTAGNGLDLTADGNAITVTVDETELDLAAMGGSLGVAQGGTGATTFAADSLLVGDGTNAITTTPAGVEGQYLQFTGGAFVWSTITEGTNDYNDLINTPTLATVATTGSYDDLVDAPTLFSGSYNDLTDTPTLFSGDYADLTGAPTLATVATSGSYNDLSDLPDVGEDNDGSSLGADPAIYAGMDSTSLTFRGIGAASNRVTTALSGDTNSVDIDVVEANLALNNIGGTLGVAKGGTGATTLTANGLLFGNGTDPVTTADAPTTSNTFLRWTGTAFEWAAIAGGGGVDLIDDLSDVDTASNAPDDGDILSYNGSAWVPAADAPVTVADDGTLVGTQRQINFTGDGVTVTEDAGNGRIDVNIPSGGGGGPVVFDGPYIVEAVTGSTTVTAASSANPEFSVAYAGSTVTVTHTLGRPPVFFSCHGISTGGVATVMFNASLRMTYNVGTSDTTFTMTGVNGASTGATTGGTAHIHFYF